MNNKEEFNELLNAGAHFGHLRRKWNPEMAPYIFTEKNEIHIIDLNKTIKKLDEACKALKQIASSGKTILFVATKKQAKNIVAEKAKSVNMPYVSERWFGGTLTNFATIRKAIKKMKTIDKMFKDGTLDNAAKRERLAYTREKEKINRNLGSISNLNKLPSAIFIVDIHKEHIAVKEAQKLNIPTFAIVDTNSDPGEVDFPIPANDDAKDTIESIMTKVTNSVQKGLEAKIQDKEKQEQKKKQEENKEKKTAEKTEDKGKAEDKKTEKTEEKEKSKKAKSKTQTTEK